jgi:hypothetical protein
MRLVSGIVLTALYLYVFIFIINRYCFFFSLFHCEHVNNNNNEIEKIHHRQSSSNMQSEHRRNRGKIDTSNTYKHGCPLYWLPTAISIESGRLKLVLYA